MSTIAENSHLIESQQLERSRIELQILKTYFIIDKTCKSRDF